MFEWDSQLETGIDSIDQQHQQLVAMLGRLFEAMKDGAGVNLMSGILDSLEDYAISHFADEEKLMESSGYAEIAGHQATHKLFHNKVKELKQDFQQDLQGALSIRVVLFLRDWLINHIGSIDQQLSEHLQKTREQ